MEESTYHHKNLKEELILAGVKLLDEEGYENFSLRAVAKACGVSHTAPYRHFKSKDALIYAIAAHVLHKFYESLEASVLLYPDDPAQQLHELGFGYIKFFLENPAYLRLIFLNNEPFRDIAKNNGEDDASLDHPFSIFRSTLERNLAKYSDNGTDPAELALATWGLVHGISVLLIKGDFEYDGDVLDLVRRTLGNQHFFHDA